MTDFLEFITKDKWSIRFVPWRTCETGIVVKCDAMFTSGEFKEFYIDLWKAMFKRYEKSFPNDVKPPHNVEKLAELLQEEVGEEVFL
jgi:hypothetical protein